MKTALRIAFAFLVFWRTASAQDVPSDWKDMAGALYEEGKHEQALSMLLPWSRAFENLCAWEDYHACELEIADNLDELGRGAESANRLETARETLLFNEVSDYRLHGSFLMWQGLYELWSFRFAKSLQHLDSAIELYEKNGDLGDNLVRSYINAGQIFVRRLDYSNALRYFNAAERVDTTGKRLVQICLNRGTALYFLKEYEDAILNYKKALDAGPDEYYRALLNSGLATCYIALDRHPEEAMNLIGEAVNYFRQEEENGMDLAFLYASRAQLYAKKEDFGAARAWFERSLEAANAGFQEKNRENAKLLLSVAEYYEMRRSHQMALYYYQQAIIQVVPDFDETDWRKNPGPESAYVESFGMTAPARKAKLLLKLAQETPDENRKLDYLQAAAGAFDLSFAFIRKLRDSYSDEEARLYIGDYIHDHLEKALEVHFLLHDLSGNTAHLEQYFQLMEINKAGVLTETLRKNQALISSGLPAQYQRKEIDMRKEIADLDAGIRFMTEGSDERKEAELVLERLQGSYSTLLDSLKARFPLFRRYLERAPAPSLGTVRNKLSGKATLAEYFDGANALYGIWITREKAGVFKIDKEGGFREMQEKLSGFFGQKSAILKDPAGYFELSFQIFRKVCPFPTEGRQLWIVPDGTLSFLPFEALLTRAGWNGNFSNAPYLLRHASVGYLWSAGLWLSEDLASGRGSKNGRFFHFAPRFYEANSGLPSLEFGKEETAGFPFKRFLDEEAHTRNFAKCLGSPIRIIHLSSHGNTGSDPGIAFFDRKLSLAEIFGLRMETELVVLSACETGLGQVEKGEGIMNFTYGFAYSGASNVMASLWKVNEQSTAKFFGQFYRELKTHAQIEGLHIAKQSWLELENPDYLKSPYYWAGFVHYGPGGVISTGSKPIRLPLAGALGLVVLSLGFFLYRKWRKKANAGVS